MRWLLLMLLSASGSSSQSFLSSLKGRVDLMKRRARSWTIVSEAFQAGFE